MSRSIQLVTLGNHGGYALDVRASFVRNLASLLASLLTVTACGGAAPPAGPGDEVPKIIINPKGGSELASRQAAPGVEASASEVTLGPPNPGALATASVLAASGQLARSGAFVEISVSPQDAAGTFIGTSLEGSDFEFSGVHATAAGGTDAVPLELKVTRIDSSGAPLSAGGSLVLLFDSSGSMKQNDPDARGRVAAVQALLEAAHSSLAIAVLDFGAGTTQGMSASRMLQPFTTNRVEIDGALKKLESSGGTPLYPAANDALTLLESDGRGGAILLLTDGQASGGPEQTFTRARQLGVPIYVVGLGRNLDFRALRALSLETGGFFVEAGQSDALAQAYRAAGTGISVGKVRIFGEGPGPALKPGVHMISGDVLTRDPQTQRKVTSPFRFSAEMTQ